MDDEELQERAAARDKIDSRIDSLSEIREAGITSHHDVFSYFADYKDDGSGSWAWTIPELAVEMSISQSTARRYVGDLVRAGLLHQVNLTRPARYGWADAPETRRGSE
jgi:response regulator of citrate/malate metabolism